MRCSTTSVLILAASSIGRVLAGPSHIHLHRRAHEKRSLENVDWDKALENVDWDKIDWSKVDFSKGSTPTTADTSTANTNTADTNTADTNTANTNAANTSTTDTNPAANTSSSGGQSSGQSTGTPSSSGQSSGTSSYGSNSIGALMDELSADIKKLVEDVETFANDLKEFGEIVSSDGTTGDNAMGNYGKPYGSNMMKVDAVGNYPFTNTFVNTQSVAITVFIWNKVGPDFRPLSGSSLAPRKCALTFVLAAGASQVVAFNNDSQVAWAEAVTTMAESGAFATTWGEANFVPSGSGYDMSCIMNPNGNTYDMEIISVEASCKSNKQENYWLTDKNPIGTSDGSCYVSQSEMHLTTRMGGGA